MELHDNLLDKLKCANCELFLSCAPVLVTKSGQNICGRCSTDEEAIRNEVYEILATNAKFPCRYNQYGCTYSPDWSQVLAHEENCDFRQLNCPNWDMGCVWRGSRLQILDHFKEKHEDCIHFKKQLVITYNLQENCEKNILLSVFGFIFLVQVKISVDLDKIWHCVRYIGNSKCISQFYCTIEMSKNSAKFTDIIPISQQENYMQINTEYSHEHNISGIESILKGSDIQFTLTINETMNIKLLNETKCIFCQGYTKPPIFHIGGSPVCSQCAPSECSISSDLTSLGLQLLYPCIHKNKGCTNFHNLKYIWKHEIFYCKFFLCFICNQVVDGTIDTHFKRKHVADMISLEEVLNAELNESENWFLITSNDKKFLGQYTYDEHILNIMLCSNLPYDMLSNTTCNVKIIDFSTKKTKFIPMTQKMQDAFDWSVNLNCKELCMLNGERINLQFEFFKTVSAE